MPPLTKSPEALCFWIVHPAFRPSIHASVIGFHYSHNLRMAEGIQVKLGISLSYDKNFELIGFRHQEVKGQRSFQLKM